MIIIIAVDKAEEFYRKKMDIVRLMLIMMITGCEYILLKAANICQQLVHGVDRSCLDSLSGLILKAYKICYKLAMKKLKWAMIG